MCGKQRDSYLSEHVSRALAYTQTSRTPRHCLSDTNKKRIAEWAHVVLLFFYFVVSFSISFGFFLLRAASPIHSADVHVCGAQLCDPRMDGWMDVCACLVPRWLAKIYMDSALRTFIHFKVTAYSWRVRKKIGLGSDDSPFKMNVCALCTLLLIYCATNNYSTVYVDVAFIHTTLSVFTFESIVFVVAACVFDNYFVLMFENGMAPLTERTSFPFASVSCVM